jgi:hypothetical protein
VLNTMDAQKYEYQSEFAKRYVAQGWEQGIEEGIEQGIERGRTQGELTGRVALVLRLLALRFGPVTASARERIQQSSIEELDAIGERLLSAPTLQDALG